VIASAVSLAREICANFRNPLLLFGSYSIGKEKLFLAVARALDLRIYASSSKVSKKSRSTKFCFQIN
jgi:hypothetical protein